MNNSFKFISFGLAVTGTLILVQHTKNPEIFDEYIKYPVTLKTYLTNKWYNRVKTVTSWNDVEKLEGSDV